MIDIDKLAEVIDAPGIDGDPSRDITRIAPGITEPEALAVQIAVKRRRVAAGDRIVGHQASFTSAGIRKLFPDAPRPMVGTLLASLMRSDGDEVLLDADETFIETELGVLLKRDLAGADLSRAEILAAIEAYLPAIEIAPVRPGVREGAFSYAHMIAIQKAVGGFVVLGEPRLPASFDARLEGCLVSINGQPRAGAIGFEAMGDPIHVIQAMVAKLAAIGEGLKAGQFIITGSLPPPQAVRHGDLLAEARFQTLGSITVHFAPTSPSSPG